MKNDIKISFKLFVILGLLTGLFYPLGMTFLSNLLFSKQAKGSLIVENGNIVGSKLIGQNFTDPRYLWGRPSATGSFPYNATASSGSNLGPMNPALINAVEMRVKVLKGEQESADLVPVDLVTSSASGLDPHLSPAAARYQMPRILKASGISEVTLRSIFEQNTESRTFGILGEPRVNVLAVNLALKAFYDKP